MLLCEKNSSLIPQGNFSLARKLLAPLSNTFRRIGKGNWMNIISKALVVLGCLTGFTVAAHASLIGDEISAELLLNGSTFDGPNVHTVGAGVEGNWFGQIAYDLATDTITVSSLQDAAQYPNISWRSGLAFSFFDLDWLPTLDQIIGVSVLSATGAGWSLIDDSDLSFTANSVLIDASKIAFAQVALDQQVTIQLQTRHAVPLANTVALTSIGFLGLVWSRRRGSLHQKRCTH